MEEEKHYRLEILEGSNYAIWKWQMESVLKAKKLFDVVSTKDTKDLDKSNLAHALIASALSRADKMKVINCKTACEVWTRLESVYENKTSFETQTLLGKLHGYKIKSMNNLIESISEIQSIAAKLELLGEKVSNKMVMSIILTALPSNYSQFITSWRLLKEEDRTLENLISNIISIADDSLKTEDKAYVAQRRPFGRRKFKPEPGKTIEKNKVSTTRLKERNKQNRACFTCGEQGHFSRECPKASQRKPVQSSQRNDEHSNDRNRNDKRVSFMAQVSDHVASTWIVDSGSSCHMTPNIDWFTSYRKLEPVKTITLADGHHIEAIGIGTIETTVGQLLEVCHVPRMAENLFSLLAATKNGVVGIFQSDAVVLMIDNKEIIRAHHNNSAYYLELEIVMKQSNAMAATTLDVWHQRFGHISRDTIKRMAAVNAVDGLKIVDSETKNCQDCALGKCHKTVHRTKSTARATKPGISLHVDTVGPINYESRVGSRYFIVCKDEYSGYRLVKCIPDKTRVATELKLMISKAELETSNKVLRLVSDQGTEFLNNDLRAFLEQRGINHDVSVAYAHEQNGLIERDIRTVVECARTILNKSKLPKDLWAEAINTAVYTLNRSLGSKMDKVPYELWFGKKPKIDNLLIFGQQVVVHVPEEKRRGKHSKFDNKGSKMIFVGYTEVYNTYRVLNEETNRIEIVCDVTPIHSNIDSVLDTHAESSECVEGSFTVMSQENDFNNEDETEATDRNELTSSFEVSQNSYKSAEISSDQVSSLDTSLTRDDTVPLIPTGPATSSQTFERAQTSTQISPKSLKQSLINKIPKQLYIQKKPPEVLDKRLRDQTNTTGFHAKVSIINYDNDPLSYSEAISREDKHLWLQAMEEEMSSMSKNDVWDLVERPSNCNIVSNKWVFKTKRRPDGEVDRYKARLVARGFSQIYGIDYHETYAPVANMVSIRLLLAYAAVERLELALFDIKTAFLYGKLDEVIFMEQPEGFEQLGNQVCRLKKSLYGLKQAPRMWNKEFTHFIKEMELEVSDNDGCIFYRKDPIMIIAIYVDDGIIFARRKEDIDATLDTLRSRFETHSIEGYSYLGFQLHRGTNGDITIHQEGYIKKVLNKFGMENSSSTGAPITISQTKAEEDVELDSQVPYREAVGSLMYAAIISRIDIMHAVCKASRHNSNPKESDWRAVKRIFRYLRDKESFGLTYGRNKNQGLVVYCDADFAGDLDTGRSTTGFVILYGGAPIHWKSQRQSLITLSSTEAEYVSMCSTVKETVWLRKLATELGIIDSGPTLILCDNESAIKIASNEKSSHRTRHMHVQAAYPREKIENGEIEIQHVKTDKQLADMLTKPTTIDKFIKNRNMLMTTSGKILTALVCSLALILSLVSAFNFKKVDPVQWLSTKSYVEQGVTRYTIDYHFTNPCEILPHVGPELVMNNSTIHANMDREMFWNLKKLCTGLYNRTFLPKIDQLVKYTPKLSDVQKKKKRGVVSFLGGVIVGMCLSNIVSSIFDRIMPGSDYKRLISAEDKLVKFDEMKLNFEKNFNITREVEQGVLRRLKDVNKAIHDEQLKLDHLIEILPHYTWMGAYIQSRVIQASEELKAIIYEASLGRVATEELASLLNMTELRGINNLDTTFESAQYPFAYGGKESHNEIILVFSINYKSTDTHVYKVSAFKHWENLSTIPSYKEYQGEKYLIYNTTSNCARAIDEPDGRSVIEECREINGEDSRLKIWTTITTSDKTPMNKTLPAVKKTVDGSYIYCFPHQISIDGKIFRCPAYVFKLTDDISYEVGHHRHRATRVRLNATHREMIIDSGNLDIGSVHSQNITIDELDFIDHIKELQLKLDQMKIRESEVVYIEKYTETWWSLIILFVTTILVIIYMIVSICRQKETVVYAKVKKRKSKTQDLGENVELVDMTPKAGTSFDPKLGVPPPPPALE